MASPPSQYGAISTHVSVRRRTKHTFSPYYMMRNFNSRLRKETNFNVPIAALLSIISIHVSVRRRTQKSNLHYIYIKISTHVSVRRRTTVASFVDAQLHISTHVSVRRRTHVATITWYDAFGISTHVSVKRRTLLYSSAMLLFLFQLTSPQGDEQFATFLVASELPHFNSRLCKETNARQTYDYYLTRIFQLTSP